MHRVDLHMDEMAGRHCSLTRGSRFNHASLHHGDFLEAPPASGRDCRSRNPEFSTIDRMAPAFASLPVGLAAGILSLVGVVRKMRWR
jgi:hypothetical protein